MTVQTTIINIKYKVQEIKYGVGQINIAVILKEHDTYLLTDLLTAYFR